MSAHFGLDIGFYSIKLIQARKRSKGFELISYGEIRTPADINSEADKDKLAIVEAIKKLVSDCRPNAKNTALALSETNVFSQVITLPYLSKNELASAINFEAEQYIPVPLNEVQLEYLVLKTPPKGALNQKMEVLLIAAKKLALEKIVDVTQKAGLMPVLVETEVISLIRSLSLAPATTGLILDLGHRSTDLMIVSGETLRFVRTINTGGEAITRALAASLNMDLMQAEQYKISYGLDADQLEAKVAKAILSTFEVIVEEIKRALAFFGQKQPETKVNYIILTGGGAGMPGLSSYLTKAFNLETLVFDPFGKFIKNDKFPKIIGVQKFAIGVGLAIRQND